MQNMSSASWLEMDPRQACQRACVVGFGAAGVSADSQGLLEEVVQRWVEHLAQRRKAELFSATVRQASVSEATQRLLRRARQSGRDCLALNLFKGECLVLAREEVLRRLGTVEVVEKAHFEALRRARDQGQPVNAEALKYYEARHAQRPA